MSRIGQLDTLNEILGKIAGAEIQSKVMEGREKLKPSSSAEKVAVWVKGAMDRLDAEASGAISQQVMLECGYYCSTINKSAIAKGKARRAKFSSVDEYIAAEEEHPSPGTRLVLDEEGIHQFYTPKHWSHPLRCYCSLVNGLPEGETISKTYCQCSRGFVQKFWEAVLERPVVVELGLTALTGSEECEFIIR
jgi:hypothetical protein